VVRNVDKGRVKLHQRIEVIINRIDGFALQWWKDLKRHQGLGGLPDMINNFHCLLG
jgi:hypothetical protein